MSRRTSVVLDDELIDQARRALGTHGIKDTLDAALREAIRADRRRRLVARFTTGEGLDLEALREARAGWGER
jgi:Arc/MetJ family transcription regulator